LKGDAPLILVDRTHTSKMAALSTIIDVADAAWRTMRGQPLYQDLLYRYYTCYKSQAEKEEGHWSYLCVKKGEGRPPKAVGYGTLVRVAADAPLRHDAFYLGLELDGFASIYRAERDQ
jgi:hypothetical protein